MALPTRAGTARHAWHIAGLVASIVIFSSPTLWTRYRQDMPSYAFVTIAFGAVMTMVVIGWPRVTESSPRFQLGAGTIITALSALALVGLGLHRWMDAMLWQPLDAVRGDMLVVVQAGIRALMNGRDPYGIYQVPWAAPLPYGPVLWGPFIVPYVLHADLRLLTIVGEAFVPVWCAVTAIVESARGRLSSAVAWLTLLAVIVLNPELVQFTPSGHTPSYWPLIPLFAVFVTANRWNAAAAVLGLLVAGRTTMVAMVPVFFIAIWWRNRAQLRSALLFFSVPLALVIAPFAVWNPATMWDGMVASYPRVMKTVVWPSLDLGAIRTIGVTGWLLAHQLQAYVEATQIVTLGLIYALAWRAIGRRDAPAFPWMGFALLGFSMTTLWPVYYVYFDVLLMFVSGAIAYTLNLRAAPARIIAGWVGSIVAITAAVWLALMIEARSFPVADVGAGARRQLYMGFVAGGAELSGSAVISGREASLTLPRRSTSSAGIVMNIQPVIPADLAPQAVTATLNGVLLGTVYVERGWSDIRFDVPQSAWRAGSNRLDLECASATPPREVGLGSDTRHMSLAVRRVEVVPQ